jgi:DNA-binding FrmR family transcriptional regulator
MVENDRYSGDEIQQASAITAAVREVALMFIAQQLEVGLNVASCFRRSANVISVLPMTWLSLVSQAHSRP